MSRVRVLHFWCRSRGRSQLSILTVSVLVSAWSLLSSRETYLQLNDTYKEATFSRSTFQSASNLDRSSMPSLHFQDNVMDQYNAENNFDLGSLMNYEFSPAAGSFQTYTDVDARTSSTEFTPTVCYPTITFLPHSSDQTL
jgi:hypothetical protein